MSGHSKAAYDERIGDLGIGHPVDEQDSDFAFSWRQIHCFDQSSTATSAVAGGVHPPTRTESIAAHP